MAVSAIAHALERFLGWVRPALLIYAGIVVVLGRALFVRLPTGVPAGGGSGHRC